VSAGVEPYERDEDEPWSVGFRRRWNGTSRHLWSGALGPFGVVGGLAGLSYLTGVELPRDVWRVLAIPVVLAFAVYGPRAAFVFGRELSAGHHLLRFRRWLRGRPFEPLG